MSEIISGITEDVSSENIEDVLSGNTEDGLSKKRGRKAVKENYFDVREEESVRNFLIA
jgi:hypothetical protein